MNKFYQRGIEYAALLIGYDKFLIGFSSLSKKYISKIS
jgi:hypothetical protein